MIVRCETCERLYDDAECWTICPHGPLWAANDAYCREHDLVNCQFHKCQHCAAGHPFKAPAGSGRYHVVERDGAYTYVECTRGQERLEAAARAGTHSQKETPPMITDDQLRVWAEEAVGLDGRPTATVAFGKRVRDAMAEHGRETAARLAIIGLDSLQAARADERRRCRALVSGVMDSLVQSGPEPTWETIYKIRRAVIAVLPDLEEKQGQEPG